MGYHPIKSTNVYLAKKLITAVIWRTQSSLLWRLSMFVCHPEHFPTPKRPDRKQLLSMIAGKTFNSALSTGDEDDEDNNNQKDMLHHEDDELKDDDDYVPDDDSDDDNVGRSSKAKGKAKPKPKGKGKAAAKKPPKSKAASTDNAASDDREIVPVDIAPFVNTLNAVCKGVPFSSHHLSNSTDIKGLSANIVALRTGRALENESVASHLVTRTGIDWSHYRSHGMATQARSIFPAALFERGIHLSHRQNILNTYAGKELRRKLSEVLDPLCDNTIRGQVFVWPDSLSLPRTVTKQDPPAAEQIAPKKAWSELREARKIQQAIEELQAMVTSISSSFLARVLPSGRKLFTNRKGGPIAPKIDMAIRILRRVSTPHPFLSYFNLFTFISILFQCT